MKHQPHQREKKTLSISGLLSVVKKVFAKIPNAVKARKYSLSDCLMSALAMFSLKSPSLLAFDGKKVTPMAAHNLRTLYGVDNTPSDTHMREILDEVDPKTIREGFLSVFHEAQRGKLLEEYEFQGSYLCLVDGTEIFNSEKIHCKNCCKKEHKDGRTTYHHQILGAAIAHPDRRQVIPLCPEPILKQDGTVKNDCERNAFHRFITALKKEHPRLKLTIVSDALSATAPHINELKDLGYGFIIVAKPEGNRSLYEWVKGITREVKITVGRNKYTFRYVNNVPLNETKNTPMVNFLECEWEEVDGKKGKKITKGRCGWVINHEITDKNVYELMRGGRARWKIENETFNTLKNQGYQFEHNFGHGKKNLHTVFALLMVLAFLIDQIQEATCGLFQTALKYQKTRRAFWEQMRGLFYSYYVEGWKAIFDAMNPDFKGFGTLKANTS
jgi:hypothetical protein